MAPVRLSCCHMSQCLELADLAASAACAASAALSAEYPWLLAFGMVCSAMETAVEIRSDRRCHSEILHVSEGCRVALVVSLVVVVPTRWTSLMLSPTNEAR